VGTDCLTCDAAVEQFREMSGRWEGFCTGADNAGAWGAHPHLLSATHLRGLPVGLRGLLLGGPRTSNPWAVPATPAPGTTGASAARS
jgi:hypothetical protein